MKEKIINALPYIITLLLALTLVIVDVSNTNKKLSSEYDELDMWARNLVESSEVMVNNKIYHGVYDTEEIMNVPEGFEIIGSIQECIEDGVELTKNFTSHVLQPGYKVYADSNNDSVIYIKITEDDEEFQSFLPYYLEIEGIVDDMLENIILILYVD